MDHDIERRTEKKVLAQFEIARALVAHDLDDWSKSFLASAIASLHCGLYELAVINTTIASFPQGQRLLVLEPNAEIDGITREQLESALADISQQPPRATSLLR